MSLLAELIAALAPPACAACGVALADAAALLCARCACDVRWLGGGGCRRCGLLYHGGRPCPAAAAAFASAWAPVAYEGPARDLVHALKFRGALRLAGFMAAQVAANAPAWAVGGSEAVVAVPPAPDRRRRRGFDSAELLAREVAARLQLPILPCLRRARGSPRQLGARRAQRRAPGRVAVWAVKTPPAAVLLVDDVHTTGATLDACARALRVAGAVRVHALAYARAL